uniref:Uncharacterized protein n=1 Tax=Anguilla anguilla TaxID=7936 RepID=A0A0E9TD86_ANGAN
MQEPGLICTDQYKHSPVTSTRHSQNTDRTH